MIYIIPGLGDKKYNLPKYISVARQRLNLVRSPITKINFRVGSLPSIKYLRLSIDDVLNLPKLPKNSVLIGFSVGAIIAYLISLSSPVKKLILCSPSPIIVKYKKPKGEIYVLSGNKETTQMQKYAHTLAKKLGGTLIKVNSRHKLTDTYIGAILKIVNQA